MGLARNPWLDGAPAPKARCATGTAALCIVALLATLL
jgi:hypothetical protein